MSDGLAQQQTFLRAEAEGVSSHPLPPPCRSLSAEGRSIKRGKSRREAAGSGSEREKTPILGRKAAGTAGKTQVLVFKRLDSSSRNSITTQELGDLWEANSLL